MLKLAKYLKKSIIPILMIFGLLVVQAMCDLALPDYTSKIVDVGIQQGGIENATPKAATKAELDKILLFMNQSEQQTVLQEYCLLERENLSDSEYKNYVEDYPALENEPIYVLDTKEEDTIEKLSSIFAKPILLTGFLEQDNEQTARLKEQLLAQMMPAGSSQETSAEQIDLFAVLSNLPKEQMEQLTTQIEESFGEFSDSMVEQGAASFLKTEYERLGMSASSIQTGYILRTGLKMLGVSLLAVLATILVGFLASRVAASLGRDLRSAVFKKVVSFSNQEMDEFSTASLITRSTNDIQQIQMLMVMLLRIVFYAPILGIGGVIKVLGTNTSMTWIIAVGVTAVLTLVIVLFCIAMPRFKVMQKLVDRLNLVTREILTGLPVIRAFSTEKYEEKRFDKANRDLTRTNLFVNRVMTCMMPTMMLMMNIISIMIVWFGAKGIDAGQMQVGDMMAFLQYTMQIIMSFLMISIVSIMLPRASVSAGRIAEVLRKEPAITDPVVPKAPDPAKRGVVEFQNVSFRYPNAEENVLSGISFTANPGQTTAFIGSTGSGKSTLVNLIPRFYDVTQGKILVDGVNIKDMTQHDLHEKIGYVPQQGVLFSGTIASNIKYGKKDASDEQMRSAAEVAQAMEFICQKEDTFHSEISQGGTNVSGGQKQRLSIARAIAKDPEIYIFDDSFSALDFQTDRALRAALKDKTVNSTVLIVAQRISTIMHAEQIVVLDEGQIVGIGTHKELLDSCEVYQQIALSQLSKEELAQ